MAWTPEQVVERLRERYERATPDRVVARGELGAAMIEALKDTPLTFASTGLCKLHTVEWSPSGGRYTVRGFLRP